MRRQPVQSRLVLRWLERIVRHARRLLGQRWLGNWRHKRLGDNGTSCDDGILCDNGLGGGGSGERGEVVPRPEEHSEVIPRPEERSKVILQARNAARSSAAGGVRRGHPRRPWSVSDPANLM